ncbi:MAG: hypothetical protein KBD16_02605 [Candidatus Pacebacteria bacterium]|nr:hypothetical protein [Candidatus Paceibacterota bacterium]
MVFSLSALLPYLGASIVGISNMILWGLYGDLLVEKFELKKVFRSVVFALVASVFLYVLDPNLPLFLVALSSIALERLLTELYKALWRNESQEKYAIPSDLNLTLTLPFRRLLFVVLVVLVAFLILNVSVPASGLLLGIIAGCITAVGGDLKDAPYEGFQLAKFFRSPIIATAIGLLLTSFFPLSAGMIVLLAIFGGERIVSEFYKKILMGRVPGKFKETLPESKRWKQSRRWLLLLYLANITLLVMLVFA